MLEYRGFAGSEGKAEHLNVVGDATSVLQWLNQKYDRLASPILVMGQSYGAQVAIKVVSESPDMADGLIVEGAFTSFKDIAVNFTPRFARLFTRMTFSEPYNGQALLRSITLPKLIIHSDDDKVVPFFMGQSLYNNAAEPKAFWQVSGGHITATKQHAVELDKRLKFVFAI